jgi:hypothetical protein
MRAIGFSVTSEQCAIQQAITPLGARKTPVSFNKSSTPANQLDRPSLEMEITVAPASQIPQL